MVLDLLYDILVAAGMANARMALGTAGVVYAVAVESMEAVMTVEYYRIVVTVDLEAVESAILCLQMSEAVLQHSTFQHLH